MERQRGALDFISSRVGGERPVDGEEFGGGAVIGVGGQVGARVRSDYLGDAVMFGGEDIEAGLNVGAGYGGGIGAFGLDSGYAPDSGERGGFVLSECEADCEQEGAGYCQNRFIAGDYGKFMGGCARASNEPVPLGEGGDSAGLEFAEPAGSVARDEVVDGVADGGGDYAEEGGYREREAEEGEHAEDGVGTEADGLTFNEDY